MSAENGFLFDFSHWPHLLDSEKEVFSSLLPGASIGLLCREKFGFPEARALVWKKQGDEMTAEYKTFTAIRNVGVDVLFVADNASLEVLYSGGNQVVHNMNRLIREGSILFYVFRSKDELMDLGFEDLLDSLGLTFMGACR